jgi:hypothetical protein
MASAASAASAAGGTTTTVPEREFAGLDYANEKADEYRAALDTGANVNSRECTNSSPVDFLYLSTIRGGRKTKQMSASGLMSAGGCGCGLVGGARRRSRNSRGSLSSRRIRGGYEEDGVGVDDSSNSGNSDAKEYANKYNDQYYDSDHGDNNNTIGEAGETGDVGNVAITGGCFTCKKGIKNITHIYSTIHIIIPTLYGKYKKGVSLKAQKAVKTIQKKPKK